LYAGRPRAPAVLRLDIPRLARGTTWVATVNI
jgi:hypothetical protein